MEKFTENAWYHTTSYHPIVVERFHCQLKGAFKANQHPKHWTEILPLVLLGIHTAFKEDIACIAAELLYGTILRLPEEFFSPSSPDTVNEVTYVAQLKSVIVQNRHNQPHNPILISAPIWLFHHMCLCAMMPFESHCNHLMMDPSASSTEPISSTHYTSMVKKIQSTSADSSLLTWTMHTVWPLRLLCHSHNRFSP